MIFHLKQFSTKSTIFVEIYFMIWRNDTFWFFDCAYINIKIMCSVHQYVQGVEVLQDNGL